MTTIRYVSAFAGVAGFECGLALAGGFECTAQIEWKNDRQRVLAERFPGIPMFGDITEVAGADILNSAGRPDAMVAGFPCQDVSIAAPHRDGIRGARSAHFFEFTRLVDEVAQLVDDLDPRWVVLENTPGLLTSHRGQDMERVLHTMVELGYGVAFRVLDAASAGGGQRRQRVLVLGHRGGDPRPAAQVLDLPGVSGEDPGLGDTGRSSRRGPKAALSPEDHDGRLIFRKSRRPRSSTDYATYVPDTQLNTLNGFDSGFGPRQTNVILDQGRLRFLTLEEWEIAQGFEPGWTAPMGKDGPRFSALGDAMNVHLARWLGERLAAVHASLPMIGAPA